MIIKILGSGCANCLQLEKNVRLALDESGKSAEIVKVSEFREILSFGVMKTPGLVLDGVLKVSGRVPEVKEIQEWIAGL